MLHLASTTPPEWAPRVLADLDTILLDHAHLEKKAAQMALTLLYRYPDQPALLRPLSELAREELEHFEQVLGHLEARGHRFGKLYPAPYASRLMSAVRRDEPNRLLDTLLVCALIEARSCERMTRLAQALGDEPALEAFYRGLLASEARHHALYVDLACQIFDDAVVRPRLAELATHEAAVLAQAPTDEPRLHN
jgi:tRNA 2-(methylsulfanyl)-N6-isopentenyladenosine37 hydroxylase